MHNLFRRSLSSLILYAILLLPFASYAQNIPPGQDTQASGTRFQDEAEARKAELESKGVKAPKIDMEDKKRGVAAAPGISFVLNDVKITGSSLFEPKDFQAFYQNYIGKTVTSKEINEMVDKIESRYKERGFLTTDVYIPEQQITGGILEIRVAEGKLGKITVEGTKWFTKKLVSKYIHAKQNELLNIKELQRDLLRLNQNPDLEVKTVLSAGSEPGTSDIILKVNDHFPYHIGGGADNQGTRLSGKYRGSVSARATNLTANNDFVFFNSVNSADSSGQFVSYVFPIDTRGTKMAFDFSYFASKIGREFRNFDIAGVTLNFIPHMTGEIYLSEDLQISADAGLNIKSVKKYTGPNVTTDDELRLPYYKMDITKMDSLFGGGQTTFSPEIMFSAGHFLGSSNRGQPKASRASTDGYYFRYDHSLRRIQKMPWESYMLLRHQFQASSETLPSSEQFQLGGANSVRGYPEGDYLADIAATLNIDWIFPMYLIPKDYKLPRSDTPLRQQIQPVIFMDLGGGYITQKMITERGYKYLMGLGGGMRINLYNKLNVRLEWAQAVGSPPTQNGGPSNFHISANFDM